MKTLATSLLLAQAMAFPQVLQHLSEDAINSGLKARGNTFQNTPVVPRGPHSFQKRADNATQAISQAQTNCGPLPCLVFNAQEQYVSTTGEHEFRSPGKNDIRGVCPGLNAAANHGYLPRNGVASIVNTITGLGAAYGMSPDLAGFLAAYAILFTGDPLTLRWSIGGPLDGAPILPILSVGDGIDFSHNKYEGDTSITRPDIYTAGSNIGKVDLRKFQLAYETGLPEDRLTLDGFRQLMGMHQHDSVVNNPYYFAPLFSTTLVAPAAHNFVINFMSNRTAEEPSGYLDGEMFKTFFAVSGDYPNFVFNQGQERIPDNWYRRTSTNQYNAANVFQDLIVGWAAYPDTFRFGGNTNGVDTYRGVDIATLTGGQYSADQLFEGNNFACLLFQTTQQAVPDFLDPLLGDLSGIRNLLNTHVGSLITSFGCPELENFNPNAMEEGFTGAKYTGPKPPRKGGLLG